MRRGDALELSKEPEMITASQLISHNVGLSTDSQLRPQNCHLLSTRYILYTNDINWTDCFLCTLCDMNKLHCTSWPVSQFSLVASVQCNKISILVQLISVTLYMSLQTAATWYLCSTDGKFCPTYKWHEKASMFRASINDPMSWNSSLSIEINHRAIHFELHWSANLL